MSSTITPIEVGDQGNVVYLVVAQRAVFIDSGHDVDGEVDLLIREWIKAGRPEITEIILTHTGIMTMWAVRKSLLTQLED